MEKEKNRVVLPIIRRQIEDAFRQIEDASRRYLQYYLHNSDGKVMVEEEESDHGRKAAPAKTRYRQFGEKRSGCVTPGRFVRLANLRRKKMGEIRENYNTSIVLS